MSVEDFWRANVNGWWTHIHVGQSLVPGSILLEAPGGERAYFRSIDEDHYVVTDLGEALRELRLRTGDHLALSMLVQRLCRSGRGGLASLISCDGVIRWYSKTGTDLPRGICSTLLAAYRLARLVDLR